MTTARVVGNVWATRKHRTLEGLKLLLVQSLDAASGETVGEPQLAVDGGFGAGPGDTVLLIDEGGGARQILKRPDAPVRLAVCGIVDSWSARGQELRFH